MMEGKMLQTKRSADEILNCAIGTTEQRIKSTKDEKIRIQTQGIY